MQNATDRPTVEKSDYFANCMNRTIATVAAAKIMPTSVIARMRTLIGAPLRNTLLGAGSFMWDCWEA